MGSQPSQALKQFSLPKQNWQQINTNLLSHPRISHGNFKILIKDETNQQIEQYSNIFDNNQEIQTYLSSFILRQNERNIVNTKYFQKIQSNLFCTQQIYTKVYLEHIPYRLSTIKDIPIPQNLYLIQAALQGFEKLYKMVGYFKVNEDMIGIDLKGKVKVWVNSNYSKNYIYGPYYIQPQNIQQQQFYLQQKMIKQIIYLIDRNTLYQNTYYPKILTIINQLNININYNNIYQQIQSYSKYFKLLIPNYFISIISILQSHHQNNQQNQIEISSQKYSSHYSISHSKIKSNTTHKQYNQLYINPSAINLITTNQYPNHTTQNTSTPKIKFNYITPHHIPSIQQHKYHPQQQYQPQTITFYNKNQILYLDQQIVNDMAIYLSK